MNKFAEELDVVCDSIRVARLSSFLDYTDLNANLSEDDVESEEVDPETGWSYSIDDMVWFPAREGMFTLSSLRVRLATDGSQSIPEKALTDLLEELDSCIAKLTEPAARDAKFHLALLM